MIHVRRLATMACLLVLGAGPARAAQESKDSRPKLVGTARPSVAISPARVVLSAELVGGANDFEEYYCPTVVWDWDDGTRSESSADCDPYEAGKSEIKRRFTIEHRFRAGTYRVIFRLKQHDKEVAATTILVQIRPGAADLER
jgi:hypothetical protein